MLLLAMAMPGQAQTQLPSETEKAMFAQAQRSGKPTDYEAYLMLYPEGTFAEIARFEMEWALKSATPPPTASTEVVISPPQPAAEIQPQADIAFDTPLIVPGSVINGQSIAQLITGSPLFPPIDGIPETLWKGQQCSNCHKWTKEALCDQGKTYSGPTGPDALQKKHPYGGAFKAALKTYALEGCR